MRFIKQYLNALWSNCLFFCHYKNCFAQNRRNVFFFSWKIRLKKHYRWRNVLNFFSFVVVVCMSCCLPPIVIDSVFCRPCLFSSKDFSNWKKHSRQNELYRTTFNANLFGCFLLSHTLWSSRDDVDFLNVLQTHTTLWVFLCCFFSISFSLSLALSFVSCFSLYLVFFLLQLVEFCAYMR